jgi:hypothetical protein
MSRGSADAGQGPAQHTAPLTTERVMDRLVALGYHVALDDDGDPTGVWGTDRFWFVRLGSQHEILQVRGRWSRTVPLARRADLLLAVNDWNRDRMWPKAYVRTEDDGLAVTAEVSVDLAEGVTDDQLDALILRGLASGGRLFEALALQLPEAT